MEQIGWGVTVFLESREGEIPRDFAGGGEIRGGVCEIPVTPVVVDRERPSCAGLDTAPY